MQLNEGNIPVYRGHLLNPEDKIIRQHILNLMCHLETNIKDEALFFPQLKNVLENLIEMQKDGLITIEKDTLKVTEKGRPFVRNVCMAFDLLLQRQKPDTQLFSMTV